MEYNYDLSVIIPCHNLEDFILPMLKSLEAQEFDYKIELIFICDDCADKTKDIIIKYSYNFLKYSAIHIVDVDFHCAGSARNRGFDISTGRFIMFLDGDDWLINKQAFNICISSLINNPEYQLFRYRWKTTEILKKNCNCKSDHEISTGMFGTIWQYCYRRELIQDIRFPDIQPGEDSEFSNNVFKKITNYLWIDMELYFYNFGRQNSCMVQFLTKQKID